MVDDEPEVAALLAEILGRDGTVEVAASGADALRRIAPQPHRFDAVVSDLRMPEMDGIALHREICAQWPWLAARMIFVTGDTLSLEVQRLLDASHCPVIEKPFVPAEVREKVRAHCARP